MKIDPASAAPAAATGSGQQLPALDGAALAGELSRLTRLQAEPQTFRQALLALLVRMTRGMAAAYVETRSDGGYAVGPTLVGTPLHAGPAASDPLFARAAAQALDSGAACHSRLPVTPNATVIAAPCPAAPGCALVLISTARDAALNAHLMLTQLCAALVAPPTAATATPVTALCARIQACSSTATALAALSEDLADSLPACTLFTAIAMTGGELTLHAASGAAHFDQRSDLARDIRSLIESSAGATVDTAGSLDNASWQRVMNQLGAQDLCVAMVRYGGQKISAIGALIATPGSRPLDETTLSARIAPWPALLDLHASTYPNVVARRLRHFSTSRRRLLAAAFGACLVGVGGWPVTDRIGAELRLEPATQRIVSAPFAGLLQDVEVRAGDAVHAGQPVLRLDGRELALERDALNAEREQLRQRESSHRARGEIEAAQQIRLDIARLELRLALVMSRLEQLDINAPIDGVVLTAGLEKEQGRSLTVGQPLMEIAPLGRLRAEIRIPTVDIARIDEQASFTYSVDAYAGQMFDGRLARIRPRAEVGEGHSYFVAETEIENTDGKLRPGMRGHARIDGGQIALAWRFVRAPVDAFRRWRGW